jgi:hypothetical protein
MPRFVVENVVATPEQVERLRRLATARFPEIDVEERAQLETASGEVVERWTCRSTSDAQLRDWLAVGGIDGAHVVGPLAASTEGGAS